MTDPILGHIGYSPDFVRSESRGLTEDLLSSISRSLVETPRDIEIKRLRAELDRLSELVWENADKIDFTGYEDIKKALEEAQRG